MDECRLIEGAIIEVWEVDDAGHYHTQYEDRNGSDYCGRLKSDKNGDFYFFKVIPFRPLIRSRMMVAPRRIFHFWKISRGVMQRVTVTICRKTFEEVESSFLSSFPYPLY